MQLTDNLIKIISECTDELIAIIVVGTTMFGLIIGRDVPMELASIIVTFYFVKKMK